MARFVLQTELMKTGDQVPNYRQFRSSTPRPAIRHTSFPARLRVPIRRRMDHLSTLADRSFHGQSNRPGRRCLLRFLSYGVVWPQEDVWRVCHHLFGIHFHPVLCEIAACAFGWRTAWWLGIVPPSDVNGEKTFD
jgi:hypothetical protein